MVYKNEQTIHPETQNNEQYLRRLYTNVLDHITNIYDYDVQMADAVVLRRIVREVGIEFLAVEQTPTRGGLNRMIPWLEVITRFFRERFDIDLTLTRKNEIGQDVDFLDLEEVGALARKRRESREQL